MKLYYALIYPFLIYGIIVWGSTYEFTLKPVYILQKSNAHYNLYKFDCHSSPLFKSLQIIKFFDLVLFHIAIFMYRFHNNMICSTKMICHLMPCS